MKLWKIILGFIGAVGALFAVNKAKSEEVKNSKKSLTPIRKKKRKLKNKSKN